MSAIIGFGSAILAIILTPALQHYFWRTQRHAEICLALIEEAAELVAEFGVRLPEILRSKAMTEADRLIFLRWDKAVLKIRTLFSPKVTERIANLHGQISTYASHMASGGGFRISDFLEARLEAFDALYEDIGLTGKQLQGGPLLSAIQAATSLVRSKPTTKRTDKLG